MIKKIINVAKNVDRKPIAEMNRATLKGWGIILIGADVLAWCINFICDLIDAK